MKTLILCDRESARYNDMDLRLQVQTAAREAGSETNTVVLDGYEIRPCLGCFQCWVKTPGLCMMTDDCVNTVSGQLIRSEAVIMLSQICYGGYSYDIKSFLDRLIPNISPFFEIVQGKMRHKKRYEHFPCLITIGYGDCTPRERETFVSLAEKNALNMRPPKHFVFTAQSADEMSEAIKSLKNALSREVCHE